MNSLSSTSRKLYLLLTHGERRSALLLLALMTFGAILETLGVGLVIPAIGLLMRSDPATTYPRLQPLLHTLGDPTQRQVVAGGMLVLVVLYLIKSVFLAYVTWRQSNYAFGLQARLSQSLFSSYLRQPYTFHLQRNSAELIRNVFNEVSELTFSGVLPGMLLITEALVLIGITMLLLAVQPLGALVVGIVLSAAAATFYRSTRRRTAEWGQARQHHDGMLIQNLQQSLGGAKEVKVLGREAEFVARHKFHSRERARASGLYQAFLEFPRLGLELLGVVGLAALVITMQAQGRNVANMVPTLGLFAAAAFRLIPSVNRVVNAVQRLRYALPVIDTLYEELQLGVASQPATTGVITFKKTIALEDVSYTYPGAATPAVRGLTLQIGKNESVGFIGPSGSGKSTLVDLVLGLLMTSNGRIVVDATDIRDNLRAWQDQIGYVPQAIYLSDDTLRRNVAFGLPDDEIDDEAVVRAINAAQLEEFVAAQPDGLQAQIGERGVRLSGGQRQRIAIARALYHDPPVLILDEATSALDAETEADVIRAVVALASSKTVLIVAHRLSTVEHCDRLYRMEGGAITAAGPAEVILALEPVTAGASPS